MLHGGKEARTAASHDKCMENSWLQGLYATWGASASPPTAVCSSRSSLFLDAIFTLHPCQPPSTFDEAPKKGEQGDTRRLERHPRGVRGPGRPWQDLQHRHILKSAKAKLLGKESAVHKSMAFSSSRCRSQVPKPSTSRFSMNQGEASQSCEKSQVRFRKYMTIGLFGEGDNFCCSSME
jgi:hypothetical protein